MAGRVAKEGLRKWIQGVILEVCDDAVECAVDPDKASEVLLRNALRANDLPASFGDKKKKSKKKFAPGDFVECYYDGDGLWYVARLQGWVDDKARVEYWGYNHGGLVPDTWLRRTKRAPVEDAPNPHSCHDKYWAQRYLLFSRFDDIVLPDAESWYSVSPEAIARDVAEKCPVGATIDACCGCGGNAIQFALRGSNVLGVDLDPKKLRAAQHNAKVYGARTVDLVLGDAVDVLAACRGKADLVFLSPPWGGPEYQERDDFDPARHVRLGRLDGVGLMRLALGVAPNVALFLPRTCEDAVLDEFLRRLDNPPARLEANFLNNKLKAKTLYVGPHFLRR